MATDSIHKPARAPWLPAVVDFATDSHARAVAVLIVVALLAFLPGFFQIGPVDRDEARFAQATKQMIETGDYVDIRFQDETRYKKPIGIYWLQAAAVKLARTAGLAHADTTIWLYRIPSLLGAIGAVLGDLLGGACLRVPACRRPRRHHDGGLHPARRGGASRQD